MLWGMINVMQIIVHMPMLNIAFPQNAILFYSFIIDISSFDIIPTDWIKSKIFSMTENESDDNFERIGYGS
jgi:hypothetical protein